MDQSIPAGRDEGDRPSAASVPLSSPEVAPRADQAATSRPRTPDPSREPPDVDKLELVGAVLDLLPDFFYVHDYDMRFWYANRKAAEYFGHTKESLIGRRLEDVDTNAGQGKFFADLCRQIMDHGQPRLTDALPYTRPDGTRGVLRQHDIPFVNPRTGHKMLIGLSRDVTTERELEFERLRASRLERELQIAREVQAALKPSQPLSMPGLQVAGYSEPAQYAGGDFYDWGVCPNGDFVFGVGDVTGHGVGPALLAASCRAYARALMPLGLVDLMGQLNDEMCREVQEGRFITFAIAGVNPRTFACEVVSAGHGPIYVLRAGGRVEEVQPEMPPLGVVAGLQAQAAGHLHLDKGDAVVMVSDGVFEATNPSGEQMGLARLSELVASVRGETAQGMVARITDAVRAWAGPVPQADDVTLVVARRGA